MFLFKWRFAYPNACTTSFTSTFLKASLFHFVLQNFNSFSQLFAFDHLGSTHLALIHLYTTFFALVLQVHNPALDQWACMDQNFPMHLKFFAFLWPAKNSERLKHLYLTLNLDEKLFYMFVCTSRMYICGPPV